MTEPISEWPKPDAEQARFYAAAVEGGIEGPVALQALLPDQPVERLAALAERWDRTREVRAARFDLREWMAKSTTDRIDFALQKSRNQMAAYLAVHNIATMKDAALTKALKFMDVLEKVVAGTAGKDDPLGKFFTDFLDKQKKQQAKGATH